MFYCCLCSIIFLTMFAYTLFTDFIKAKCNAHFLLATLKIIYYVFPLSVLSILFKLYAIYLIFCLSFIFFSYLLQRLIKDFIFDLLSYNFGWFPKGPQRLANEWMDFCSLQFLKRERFNIYVCMYFVSIRTICICSICIF